MCRMLAVCSDPERPGTSRDLLLNLYALAPDHPDGWGVVHYLDGRPLLVKRPERADRSSEARKAAEVASPLIIGHIRQASIGSHSVVNTHPFVDGPWAFCHNGTIDGHRRLRERLSQERRERLRGDTDSEVLFHWLLQNIESCQDPERGIAEAVRGVIAVKGPGTSALNFLLSDGRTLYAYDLAFRKRHYFTMHWRQATGDHDGMAVSVSSQPLGPAAGWYALENDTLASFRDGAPVCFRPLL